MVGGRYADGLIVMKDNTTNHAFLEIFPAFVDLFGRQFVLFVGFIVHEHEVIHLPVQELGLDFLDLGAIKAITAFVSAVQDRAAQQVPQLALIERLAFAGLDEIALDHQIRIAIDLDLQALAKLAGVITSHDCYSRFAFSLG